MEESRRAFKILTDKQREKILLGRPRRRLEDTLRMDLKEIDLDARKWADSPQNRDYWIALVNAALNFWVS